MNRSRKWTSWIVALSLSALTGCATLSAPKPRLTAAQAANPMVRQLAMARLAENGGQFDRAKQLYAAVLRMDRDNVEALHRLGVIAARQGQFGQAEAHFQRALAASPDNPKIQADAGYALYLQGRYADSEAVLRQVVSNDPGNKKALNNLGLAIGRQGRYRESLDVFRQGGSEAAACNNLAYLCTQAGDYEQAQSLYSRALSLDPGMKPAVEALMQVAQKSQERQRVPGDALPPDGGTVIASAEMPQGAPHHAATTDLVQRQAVTDRLIEEVSDGPYAETERGVASAPQKELIADVAEPPAEPVAIAGPSDDALDAALQAAQQIERPRPSRRRAHQRSVSLPRPSRELPPANDEPSPATEAAAGPLPVIVDQQGEPLAPHSDFAFEPEAEAAPAAETWRAEIVYGRRHSTLEATEPEATEDAEPAVASVSDSSPTPAAPLPAPESAPRRLVPPSEPANNPLRSAAPGEDATTQSEEHVAKGHYQFAQYTEADGEDQSIVALPPQRMLGPDFRRQRPVASAALSARLRSAAGGDEEAAPDDESAEEGGSAQATDDGEVAAASDTEPSDDGQTLAERVRRWRQTRQR